VSEEEKIQAGTDAVNGRPLSLAKTGEKVRLIRVDGGSSLKQRMVSMGLLPGSSFEIVKNKGNGPLVLSVKGARLIVGRGMSDRIVVS
jgi:Fe2+ transport system protein FeoA